MERRHHQAMVINCFVYYATIAPTGDVAYVLGVEVVTGAISELEDEVGVPLI